MLITLKQAKLSRALSYVSKGVSTKPNIPVLSNILLEVDQGTLRLSSTNLDMGINMWIAGQVQSEGGVTVAAKTFTDFVAEMVDDKVTLTVDKNVLTVASDNAQAEFQTIPATEFPILPKLSGEPVLSVASDQLVAALAKVIFACSTDNSPGKSQQTGVYFELQEGESQLTLVGLDGYRLSAKKLKVKRTGEAAFSAIVPGRPLLELSKILQSEVEIDSVELYINSTKSQALFKFGEIEFSIRLLEGPFPDYKKVMPSDFAYSCEMSKREFEQGIRIINTFARSVLGSRSNFDLDPDSGIVTLSSSVTDLGSNETKIKAANITGELLKSAYNLRYISDMAGVIEGEKIIFQTKSPLAAAVFQDSGDPDFLHIIMPLRREG